MKPEDVERVDRHAHSLAEHPAFAHRRRIAVRAAIAYSALVAGLVALLITRWVSLGPINDGIKRDNDFCQNRIIAYDNALEFRIQYRDTLQDIASYIRDAKLMKDANELDVTAGEVPDPVRPDCNPNQSNEGFFG